MSKWPRRHEERLMRDYKKYDYEMNERLLRESHPNWFK